MTVNEKTQEDWKNAQAAAVLVIIQIQPDSRKICIS